MNPELGRVIINIHVDDAHATPAHLSAIGVVWLTELEYRRPDEESRPGGLRYECGAGSFALFESSGRPSGEHTQMAWQVDDIEAVVAELRNRGVVFEEYDMPGLRTVNSVAEVAGNYPSHGGVGERAAWFHDSEGTCSRWARH